MTHNAKYTEKTCSESEIFKNLDFEQIRAKMFTASM